MLPSNEYKIVDNYVVTPITLGRGAFGVVKRGYVQKNQSELVAVKIMPIDKVNQDKNFVKLLKRELEILPKLENPHIVKLYHASRTKNNFYMFLELCNGGDLKELLKKRGGKLSEQEAVTYFRHIVEGFKGIHQESVIHRDIKPANILIHDGVAKISDFGFARVVSDMDQVDHWTLLGTPLYMPPQILAGKEFSSKCDVWSLGMMFYELLYGHTPWNANSQALLAKVINEKPLVFPDKPVRSKLVKDVIAKMLEPEEDKRISWHELFVCDLVKFDEIALMKGMQQIADEKDSLDRSVQMNEMYIQNNKVMDKARNPKIQNFFAENRPVEDEQELSQKDIGSELSSQNASANIIDPKQYNQIVEAQDRQLKQTQIIQKIDAYLTFNRNVGIFVNYTTNSVFKLFKDQLIKISNHLFYRIIFLLQKYQMIQFQSLIDIMASKVPIGQGFTENDWKLYKRSKEYFSTLHSIKNDTSFIRPYFNEIFQRTQDFIEKTTFTPNEVAEIKEFKMVLTKEFQRDQLPFFHVYKFTLEEALKRFQSTLQNDVKVRQHRLFLCTSKYLKICLDPFLLFKWEEYQPTTLNQNNEEWKKEFNQFYETYDTMDLNQLLLEAKESLAPYQ